MIKFKKTISSAFAYDDFSKRSIAASKIGSDGIESVEDAQNAVLLRVKSSIFAAPISEMSEEKAAGVLKGVEDFRNSLKNDNLSAEERNIKEVALQLFSIGNEKDYQVIFEDVL